VHEDDVVDLDDLIPLKKALIMPFMIPLKIPAMIPSMMTRLITFEDAFEVDG
jgi:hypothetical protein